MDIGIIGTTGHLDYALEGIKQDKNAQIVGLAPGPGQDFSELFSNKVSSVNPDLEEYDDYLNMFEDLDLDIVVVLSYFGNHGKVVKEALEQDISTFTEKPVATDFDYLKEIKKAYRETSAELGSMLAWRFSPWFKAAKEAVDEGRIGEVRLLNAQKSYRLGERQEFYKDRDTYGGTIPWVGSHAIDWIHWISGEKFESVSASHSSKGNRNHGDLEATAICEFDMTNEVLATVSLDFLRPNDAPTHGDDRLRVMGTEGVIEVRYEKAKIINNETDGEEELSLPETNQIFLDFLKRVRGEEESLLSAEDSLYTTESCLKARSSADKNEMVYF